MGTHKLLLVFFFFSLLSLRCSSVQKVTLAPPLKVVTFSVEGKLTQTTQYCGGVAPTWEQQMEYNHPKPYQTKLYVRKGKENSDKELLFDSVMVDTAGNFHFDLPAGDYTIILPSQRKKEIINTYLKMANSNLEVDEKCLNAWWTNGLFQISVVDKNITQLDHNFFNSCFVPLYSTCFNYMGPWPP